jgi:hypothetical protein
MHRRRSNQKSRPEKRSDSTSKTAFHSPARSSAANFSYDSPVKPFRDRLKSQWAEPRNANRTSPLQVSLTRLIEQDAPLQTNSLLVLMYGPFQAAMAPEAGQGVASWIKDCLRKYGVPSLLRFDQRHRAQIFRRDQFQPWLEPLIAKQ